jgi:hypothetical protein
MTWQKQTFCPHFFMMSQLKIKLMFQLCLSVSMTVIQTHMTMAMNWHAVYTQMMEAFKQGQQSVAVKDSGNV